MLKDLLTRYLASLGTLSAQTWVIAAALLVLLGLTVAVRPVQRRWYFTLSAAVGLAAVVTLWAIWAWKLRWACDDAFISFRYARNWVDGHGLVYNPGERVEGYTNFFWTALVAVGLLLHIDPVVTSVVLGFASAVFALATAWKLSNALSPGRRPLLDPAIHDCLRGSPDRRLRG